jgi:hypothetical protein
MLHFLLCTRVYLPPTKPDHYWPTLELLLNFSEVARLRAGWPGFDTQQRHSFLVTTASRRTLGPTQPPIQWVPFLFPCWGKAYGAWNCLLPRDTVDLKRRKWAVSAAILGCNTLWTCRKIPMFRRNMLPPSSGLTVVCCPEVLKSTCCTGRLSWYPS